MRKARNLSDDEIAIAKAMLRKGWRNDARHYYFNRPDRLISSGRIAQIKAGKYGAAVEEAQPETSTRSWSPGIVPKPLGRRRLHQ